MSLSVRCGTDLIAIKRITQAVTRLGKPFLDRIWTPEEQADCCLSAGLTTSAAASLAARFAAKEATAKALGTGIGRLGLNWTDISVKRSDSGEPLIQLAHAAQNIFYQMGGQSISVSLSHEREMAIAVCVLLYSASGSKP